MEMPELTSLPSKLRRLAESERIPHSLLFVGADKAFQKEAALSFAQVILSTDKADHPDIHLYSPEGKVGLHSIAAMRKFSEDVYLSPYASHKKIFILLDAERMLPPSANALLKTFEEPAADSIIILATTRPAQMLPTVLSRCQKITIGEEVDRPGREDPLHRLLLEAISDGKSLSYMQILELSDQLSSFVDEEHKEMEALLKAEMIDDRSEQLTAVQKEALLKEMDGAVSLSKKTRVKELAIVLLSWYRDVHLIKSKGNHTLLMNPDFTSALTASASRDVPSLPAVEAAIRDAILSLERSISTKICFENLFLRLSHENVS